LKKFRAQRDNKALKGRSSIAWGAASNASETPGQEILSSYSPERADYVCSNPEFSPPLQGCTVFFVPLPRALPGLSKRGIAPDAGLSSLVCRAARGYFFMEYRSTISRMTLKTKKA